MTFQPVIPLTGYAGWSFLNRTIEQQKDTFAASASQQRLETYFRENIGSISTADELVNDHQLLTVALGAFGLEDDMYAKAFISKVLSEGTTDSDALANKLSDKRYLALSNAFGFTETPPATTQTDFADTILTRYQDKAFESAVGDVDNDLRMALNVDSAMSDILDNASTNDGQWFSMMGNTALRSVFETAMGLPSSIGSIDIDLQLNQFKSRAMSMFGTDEFSEISLDTNQEELIKMFLLRSEMDNFSAASSASIALTLLQSG